MSLLARIRLSYKNKKVDEPIKCQTDSEDVAKELIKSYVHNKYPKAERYKILEFTKDE